MKKYTLLLAMLLGAGWPFCIQAQESAPASGLSSGLYLNCAQPEPAWLTCDYRLARPTATRSVEAAVDGIRLASPKYETYPFDGATDAVLFLVDTSDPRRQPTIEKNVEQIARLVQEADPNAHLGLATFDSDLRVLAPVGSERKTLLARSRNIKALGKTTELYRNTLLAVQLLAREPADRKALFLFSDGLAEDRAYFHPDVIRAAQAEDVMIYGLGYPQSTALTVALQTLRRLSEETGGVFVAADTAGDLPPGFLDNPYAVMKSGGRIDLDLTVATAAGLYGPQNVSLTVSTEQGVFKSEAAAVLPPPPVAPTMAESAVPVPADVGMPASEAAPSAGAESPAATPETAPGPEIATMTPPPDAEPGPQAPPLEPFAPAVRPAIRKPSPERGFGWLDYVLLLGTAVLLGLIGVWLWRRKHAASASGDVKGASDAGNKPFAYLEFRNEPDRRPLPITGSSLRIGRHPDNDACLDDPSVSRHHAEIHRKRDGSFTITDLDSLNGIYVNDRQVKTSGLGEGDTLEIGDLRLRFTLYAGTSPGEEKTVMNLDKTILTNRHSVAG